MHIIAFNRHWIINWRWLLLTFTAFLILIGLAVWQWQRAIEKTTILQRLSQSQQVSASSAQQLQTLTPEMADGLQITASAHWLSPVVWLLDNQMLQGRIGYDVIVPMQLDDTHKIVLINLGWVAAPVHRSELPEVNIPNRFIVHGIVRTHIGGFRLGNNIENNGRWPMRIQQIDIDELKSTLPNVAGELYAGIVHQSQDSPYLVHYQPVVISPDRHRAYALQWGLLAMVVVIIALAASLKKDGLQEGVSLHNKLTEKESTNAKQ